MQCECCTCQHRFKEDACRFSKEGVALLLKAKHQELFRVEAARNGIKENELPKLAVARELHSDAEVHLYAAILCDRPCHRAEINRRPQTKDKVFLTSGSL